MPDRSGKRQRRGSSIRACQSVIAEVDSRICADLQRLLDRVDRTRRAHAQGNDLVARFRSAAFLGQLQCCLEGILVQFGQDALFTVGCVGRSGDMPVELRVRDVLDQNDNLQCLFHCLRSSLPCLWTANRNSVAVNCPARGLVLAKHIARRKPLPALTPVSVLRNHAGTARRRPAPQRCRPSSWFVSPGPYCCAASRVTSTSWLWPPRWMVTLTLAPAGCSRTAAVNWLGSLTA
ncbi:hypothetical protein PJL18_04040 [Paenarthrobacter nicotinovorans]|nr:hypothetical protein [Paenarthrobacter nicotinovorans]